MEKWDFSTVIKQALVYQYFEFKLVRVVSSRLKPNQITAVYELFENIFRTEALDFLCRIQQQITN